MLSHRALRFVGSETHAAFVMLLVRRNVPSVWGMKGHVVFGAVIRQKGHARCLRVRGRRKVKSMCVIVRVRSQAYKTKKGILKLATFWAAVYLISFCGWVKTTQPCAWLRYPLYHTCSPIQCTGDRTCRSRFGLSPTEHPPICSNRTVRNFPPKILADCGLM